MTECCHANGVLALTNGVYESVIRLLPPVVMEPELFRDALQVIIDGIRSVSADRT